MINCRLIIMLTITILSCCFALESMAHMEGSAKRRTYSIKQDIAGHKVGMVLLYANLSYTARDNKWTIVKDDKDKLNYDKSLFKAAVYLKKNKIVCAIIYVTAKNSKWTNRRDYYFYDNNQTAHIAEDHSTRQLISAADIDKYGKGPYMLEKRIYFLEDGRQVKDFKIAYVVDGKKMAPVAKILQIKELEYFRNSDSLPFAKVAISAAAYLKPAGKTWK
jgi:hypothetical protein